MSRLLSFPDSIAEEFEEEQPYLLLQRFDGEGRSSLSRKIGSLAEPCHLTNFDCKVVFSMTHLN